jgi:putative membrane protein
VPLGDGGRRAFEESGKIWEPFCRGSIQGIANTAIAVHRRVPMVFLRLAAALAAVGLFTSGMVFAEGAKPNDAQIAHIAYTAGQLDIAAADQAKQKSKNKDVIAFADDMERDHKAVNEKALALVKKLGVTPEDNDTSKALSKQAADKRAELAKLNGKAFDKAYIDNEVGLSQGGRFRAGKHAYSRRQ